MELDFNGNGIIDQIVQYDGDLPLLVKRDRNQDGHFDDFELYRDGIINSVEADDDFDGKLDLWVSFRRGLPVLVRKDADADGIPDIFSGYVSGVLAYSFIRPPPAREVEMVIFFRSGIPSVEYFRKESAPGKWFAREYDVFGRPLETAEAPLDPLELLNQANSGWVTWK